MICEACGRAELEVMEDEVDIGVGIQKHIIGYDCGECGMIFAACNDCGICEDGRPHQKWCENFPS